MGQRPSTSKLLQRVAAALVVLATATSPWISGCDRSPAPESYYPLEEGLVRRYVMSGEVAMFAGWTLERTGWHRTMRSRGLDNYVVAVQTQAPRLIDGVDATPIMASSDLNRDYWFSFARLDAHGVAEVGRQKRGGQPKPLEEPYYLLRFPLKRGQSWEVKEPLDFMDGEITLAGHAWIAGVDETVTVPAGTFRHCVRVEVESSGSKRVEHLHGRGIWGEATVERKSTAWFGPKIGLVKGIERTTLSPSTLGSGEQMLELTEIRGMPKS